MLTDPSKILISPSIIAADLSTFGALAETLDPGIVDLLHLDVMDGAFVPNLTFGPGYIKHLSAHSKIPLDVHLMIESPELSIAQYLELSPKILTIHYESTRFPIRLLSLMRTSNILAGISINPATPVESLSDILLYVDMVLIMSVDPGFYGQKFLDISLARIESLVRLIEKKGLAGKVAIQVDGGITKDNIAGVVKAGARILVAGNAAFSGGMVHDNVRMLKDSAAKGLA